MMIKPVTQHKELMKNSTNHFLLYKILKSNCFYIVTYKNNWYRTSRLIVNTRSDRDFILTKILLFLYHNIRDGKYLSGTK